MLLKKANVKSQNNKTQLSKINKLRKTVGNDLEIG